MRIFLACSHEDRPVAEATTRALVELGHAVSVSWEAPATDTPPDELLRRRIAAADLMVCLVSPAALASPALKLSLIHI